MIYLRRQVRIVYGLHILGSDKHRLVTKVCAAAAKGVDFQYTFIFSQKFHSRNQGHPTRKKSRKQA